MNSMKNAKKLLMIGIIAIAVLLSIGYTSISQDIREVTNKNDTAKKVIKTYDVNIVKIEPTKVIGVASAGVPEFTNNSATFNADLMKAGDTVKYEITIKNSGSKTVKLDNIYFDEQEDGSPAIIYTYTNPSDTLEPGAYTTFTVTASYDSMFLEAPSVTSKTATVSVDYSIKG